MNNKLYDGELGAFEGGLRLRDAELAVQLWPLADEAPEVPTDDILQKFDEHPEELHPDLADQIRNSVNCRRALDKLRRDRNRTDSHNTKQMTEFLNRLRSINMDQAPIKSTGKGPANSMSVPFQTKQFGQLWSTRSQVEVWKGSRFGFCWTFHPLDIVIVSDGNEMPWDDTLYRVVPVTRAELWNGEVQADDEVLIHVPEMGDFVAHLWLNYPMSSCQMYRCMGKTDEAGEDRLEIGLCALQEGLFLAPRDGAGLPINPQADTQIILERERLLVCASWLSATADARREWAFSCQKSMQIPARAALHFPVPKQQIALAAASKPLSGCRPTTFQLTGHPLQLEVFPNEATGLCIFVLYAKDGTPSSVLDGAVLTTADLTSEPFKQGETFMPLSFLAEGFRLRTTDGLLIELQEA